MEGDVGGSHQTKPPPLLLCAHLLRSAIGAAGRVRQGGGFPPGTSPGMPVRFSCGLLYPGRGGDTWSAASGREQAEVPAASGRGPAAPPRCPLSCTGSAAFGCPQLGHGARRASPLRTEWSGAGASWAGGCRHVRAVMVRAGALQLAEIRAPSLFSRTISLLEGEGGWDAALGFAVSVRRGLAGLQRRLVPVPSLSTRIRGRWDPAVCRVGAETLRGFGTSEFPMRGRDWSAGCPFRDGRWQPGLSPARVTGVAWPGGSFGLGAGSVILSCRRSAPFRGALSPLTALRPSATPVCRRRVSFCGGAPRCPCSNREPVRAVLEQLPSPPPTEGLRGSGLGGLRGH